MWLNETLVDVLESAMGCKRAFGCGFGFERCVLMETRSCIGVFLGVVNWARKNKMDCDQNSSKLKDTTIILKVKTLCKCIDPMAPYGVEMGSTGGGD